MKKFSMFALIIILFLGFYYNPAAYFGKGEDINSTSYLVGEEALVHVFELSDASFVEANTNTALYLQDTFWSLETMEEAQEAILTQLGLKDKIEKIIDQEQYNPYFIEEYTEEDEDTIFISRVSEIGYNQIIATAIEKEGKTTVVILLATDREKEKETHIIIDIVQNKEYKGVVEESNQSKEILEQYGKDIETTMSLVGAYPGEMAQEERQGKIGEIVSSLKATKQEEFIDHSYLSITAFTPLIAQALQYDGKKVNLQLAMRYNAFEDQTYLWIATPLITTAY